MDKYENLLAQKTHSDYFEIPGWDNQGLCKPNTETRGYLWEEFKIYAKESNTMDYKTWEWMLKENGLWGRRYFQDVWGDTVGWRARGDYEIDFIQFMETLARAT